MGLLSYLVVKGMETASKKAVINAAGMATATVISATAQAKEGNPDSVVKNGVLYVKPNRNSEEYIGKGAITTVNELLGCGFEKVELKANKSIGSFGIKKYGKVKSVSINGKNEFFARKKVLSSAYVVVEYNDFKDSVDRSMLGKVEMIKPGIFESIINEETFITHKVNINQNNATTYETRYCMYCGKEINDSNAKYCCGCGRELK